ncbi:MAG: type II toxin-antitoxin system RelE/ParE family toxin [Lachnospiraceae bacterium]|jgi:plasmid stabilization system protein ParE|nr:type II toxin-antitoxin system RelE/ParE family toxin [Lachnospiraceae bacterium]
MQYYKIEITDLAEADLNDIGDYIAFNLKTPITALQIMQGLRKEIRKLNQNPKRHKLDEDLQLASVGIRKHYYKNYTIFYLVDDRENSVLVLRILHILVDSKRALYYTLELE